jgi:DNA-directed RNA polymerase specialized sigma24 family protein
MTKKLRLFKGGRKRDIYDDAKWKKRAIDIDGETWAGSPVYGPMEDQWEEEKLRSKAMDIINQVTNDPDEHSIAELMLENYTEKEIAQRLNISLARVKWFMRKVEGWKRKGGGVDPWRRRKLNGVRHKLSTLEILEKKA